MIAQLEYIMKIEEIKDIMNIAKSLEASGLLIKEKWIS